MTATLAAPAHPGKRLHSARWFLVAGLRPALHAQARCQRQVQRGRVWHLVTRHDGQRSFRLNAPVWRVIAHCNGQRSAQQLWDLALAEGGDQTPTQDELLGIMARLHQAGLLSFDRRPDFDAATESSEPHGEEDTQRGNSLLAWRIPLGRPDAWLQRWAQRLPCWRGWPAAVLCALALAWLVLAASGHATQWVPQLRRLLAAPSSWGVALLAYPLLKLLHELAHGLAARRCGAPVSSWGVSILMFMPVPYVDVSAASALPLARQRMLVAGAGMLAESFVALLAFVLWMNLQAGAASDAALLVFFMAGLSTLLVNANPLLRFDGYHLLCDALQLPNLATRSARYGLQALAKALRLPPQPAAVVPAPGEAIWLWSYAPAALLMRWAVAAAVVLFLGAWAQGLGWLAAALFAWQLLFMPAQKLWRWWRGMAGGQRSKTRAALALAPVLLLGLVTAVPVPVSIVAQGVVWLPEHALVRAQADGMVQQLLAHDGQQVQPGELLMALVSPRAQTEVDSLRARVQALQADEARLLQAEPAQAVQVAHQLQATLDELAQAERRLQDLTVKAQTAGRLVIDKAADLPGRHVKRGDMLAHVITGEAGIVRLAVSHESAAQLAAAPSSASVRTLDGERAARQARWAGQLSGGVTALPSAALGDRSGGRIATDPSDPHGLKPAQPVLVGELQLDGAAVHRLGERVLVRMESGHAPLLLQLARRAQQQVLHHFNPHN